MAVSKISLQSSVTLLLVVLDLLRTGNAAPTDSSTGPNGPVDPVSCGRLVTNKSPIDLENSGSNWGQLKSRHELETVHQVVVNSANGGSVRICDVYPDARKCHIFSESSKYSSEPLFDIKFLHSAICSTKNVPNCNSKNGCDTAELRTDECARLYQSQACNNCQFDHFSIPIIQGRNKSRTMKYETIQSIKIQQNCEAVILYKDTDPNNPNQRGVLLKTGDIDLEMSLPDLTYEEITVDCKC